MRLFISLDFHQHKPIFESLQKEIIVHNAQLSFVNHFHMTLLFLGEVARDHVPDIIKKLQNISFDAFRLTFEHLGHFERRGVPTVVWAGCEKSPELDHLQQAITHVEEFSNNREFVPHVTLARVKQVENAQGFVNNLAGVELYELTNTPVTVSRFFLMESMLDQPDPVYKVIAEFPCRQ